MPIEDWVVFPVSDYSVFLDRPPVEYEGFVDDGKGEDPWPADRPLPDE